MESIAAAELRDVVEDIIAQYGEDKLVVFASDYGDHSHTQQLHVLTGNTEEVLYRKTAYSVSGFASVDVDEASDDLDTVIILS